MAEEKKEKKPEGERKAEGEKKESKGGKKKLHLHQIIHTFAHDGSAMHEHVYKDHKESPHTHPPRFMGTSQNVEDLMQHDQDHAGPAMGGGEPEGEEEEPGEGAAPAGAGAPQE